MIMNDVVRIQERSASLSGIGEEVVWSPLMIKYAAVVALQPEARMAYQSMDSRVTHKIVFPGRVITNLADYRFIWQDKTMAPVEPPKFSDRYTTIVVREV